MAPSTPYVAEELWERLGKPYSVHQQTWPSYDAALTRADEVEVVVQVNGKVRDRFMLPVDLPRTTRWRACWPCRRSPRLRGPRAAQGHLRAGAVGQYRGLSESGIAKSDDGRNHHPR